MTSPYLCMTEEEYAAWREAAVRVKYGSMTPCYDCPLAWAAERKAEGCCNREPQRTGRPRLSPDVILPARRPRRYANDIERKAARRQQWREWQKRRTEAAA